MCVAYQWLIWLTSKNSLLHEKFSNRCMAYQWLTWLTSQDLVTSQELLASNRGVAYKWLTWLTSQVLVPSWKNFQTGCAFIYGILMVDLVDLTEFTNFIKKFWICVWHISGWLGWLHRNYWLHWNFTSLQDHIESRGMAYQWLTWLTSQVLGTSWKNFQTGCAFIYGISMVDLVAFTEFTDLIKKFWMCVWHISGWLGWLHRI